MKILKKTRGAVLALALMFLMGTGAAAADMLVPGGMTVGLELPADGVIVSRLLEVETAAGRVTPAADAGIEPGDRIIGLGGAEITGAKELRQALDGLDGTAVSVTLMRGDRLMQLSITPARDRDGKCQLGLCLRDGASGIGTVTYYDPDTGEYGALGHGVNDVDSGALIVTEGGTVSKSTIVDVIRGASGHPGELCGTFDPSVTIGGIETNTPFGIFGVFSEMPDGGTALETASDAEIRTGAAEILSNIDGEAVESYDIEILKVNENASDGRSLVIKVTDSELIAETGGIVQGMSGSPIIQDGRLVGAVTHVLVSDPVRGYGISIDTMLKAAG